MNLLAGTYIANVRIMRGERVHQGPLAGLGVSIPYFYPVVDGAGEDPAAVETRVQHCHSVVVPCHKFLGFGHVVI